jgi:arylformamidase
MKIYDLTLTLTPDLVVWEGDVPIEIGRPFQLEKGDEYNLSTLKMSVHAGTHVDAPRHFLPEGKGVDQLNPEALSGPVSVIDVRGNTRIDRSILQSLSLPDSVRRLIFLTDNTDRKLLYSTFFVRDFVALDETAADWVVERGIQLIGIDALSVAPYGLSYQTHAALLNADVVIVEGLDLHGVRAGVYELMVAPLKIRDCDGAPARVILKDSDQLS